jgi:nitrate reductase gamma subunit
MVRLIACAKGSIMATLLWLVVPYLAMAVFVLGHLWRWRHDRFGWTTLRTPLVRNRLLRLGSPLVHLGVAALILGHAVGLLVPRRWTTALGITEPAYRAVSVTVGTLAGATMLAGLVLLVARRILQPSIRRTTTVMDVVMYGVLVVTVLLGMVATVGVNLLGPGHDYRETVAVWFRGILLLRPDPSRMADAAPLFQAHTLAALALVAIWPFTRLVHTYSVPIGLLWQPKASRRPPADTTALHKAV